MFTEKHKEKFWNKVAIGSPDECWNWKGSAMKIGSYGHLHIGNKMFSAHRVAFEIYYGSINESLQVMHMCDNPKCCNPKHLKQGTQSDNIQDMIKKGRQRNSTKPVKLSFEDAQEIRKDFVNGISKKKIALKYDISTRHTSDILCGKYWKAPYPTGG